MEDLAIVCAKREAVRVGGDWRELLGAAWEGAEKARTSYDPGRGATLATWAGAKASFSVREYLRTERRGRRIASEIPSGEMSDVAGPSVSPLLDVRDSAERGMRLIPARCRDVFVLRVACDVPRTDLDTEASPWTAKHLLRAAWGCI